jgi:hypothetical protein
MMRRILVLLAVMALMMVMLAMSVAPAFAGPGQGEVRSANKEANRFEACANLTAQDKAPQCEGIG